MNRLSKHLSRKSTLFVAASVVAVLAAVVARLLKLSVGYLSSTLVAFVNTDRGRWLLLILPVAGLLLTQLFIKVVAHRELAHGVRRLMRTLKSDSGEFAPDLIYTPIVATTLTLGFGGSAGSEDPIAYTGAAIGGNFARRLGMRPQQVRLLAGCGAAAGIAGIFSAPLAGALFTIEVLRLPLSTLTVTVLIVASLIAGLVSYVLSGCAIDIDFTYWAAISADIYPYVMMFGLFCGLYSIYYSYMMKWIESTLDKIRSRVLRTVLAGSVVSLVLYFLPSLYGEGYDIVGRLVNGDFWSIAAGSLSVKLLPPDLSLIGVAGAVLLTKCLAAGATTCGGVAGDFAPALFAGSVAGVLFASVFNFLFSLSLPVGLFALFGMSGVMSGAIRAPLMAIFLTVEMTAGYGYLLPLSLVASLSFAVVSLFKVDSFYKTV